MNARSLPPNAPADALLAEQPGVFSVRGWRNLAICVWTGQATGPAAEQVKRTMDRPDAHGMCQSFVHVIHNKLPLPDSAARQVFMSLLKERSDTLACIAVVVLGTGFWASAMRNAVIGLRVFAPSNFEFRVFGTCEEVVAWLPTAHEKQTGVAIPPTALAKWLGGARDILPRAVG
jgi:hypothetical protein